MYPVELTADEERRAGMIALVAINEGKTYADRCKTAREQNTNAEYAALNWLRHANAAARANGGNEEPARVLLFAAAILSAYYAEHVKEC